jgi:hypothetical protein
MHGLAEPGAAVGRGLGRMFDATDPRVRLYLEKLIQASYRSGEGEGWSSHRTDNPNGSPPAFWAWLRTAAWSAPGERGATSPPASAPRPLC